MPGRYVRKRKRRSRKRPYKRMRRIRFRRKQGVPNGLPASTRCVNLRFVFRSTLPFVDGNLRQVPIIANSARNPTGSTLTPLPGGLQPLLFDTLARAYQKVMVVGSKVKFYVTPQTRGTGATAVGQASQIMAGVYLSKQSQTPFTTVDQFIAAKRGQYKAISFQRNQTTLTAKYSMRKFFNVTDVKDNQTDFSEGTADTAQSPNRMAYFILYAQNMDFEDDRQTDLPFVVTLDMTCVFSTPRDVTDA